MNRRSFMGAILAAGVAPAIVRADSLMRIVPRDMALALPGAWPPDKFLRDLIGEIIAARPLYVSLHTAEPLGLRVVSEPIYRDYSRVWSPPLINRSIR